jgi:hypothetical protein
MKRSTWLAVLVTAGVLVVAGNLPRLPLDAFAAAWQAAVSRSVAAWPRAARRTFAPPSAPRSYAHAPLAAPARPARRALVAVAPARLLATPTPSVAARHGFALPSFPAVPLQVALPALAGVLAGALALLTFGLAFRRDRRGRVWQLARRGVPPSRIARTAGLPQDAVRTLLTPGLGSRR